MNVIAFYWYQITKISFVIGSQHPHYLGVLDLANMNTCHSPSINADNGKKYWEICQSAHILYLL